MLFQWLVGIIAIIALIAVAFSDFLSGKSMHSNYFERVQKPAGKNLRSANIPDPSKHDVFYTKLNSR